MKTIEQFAGKRLPYKENDEYVSRLISECADNAIKTATTVQRGSVKKVIWRVTAVAAMLVLGVMMYYNLTKESDFDRYLNSPTLSEVLSQMSDEDLMCVGTYELYDIPEYEE